MDDNFSWEGFVLCIRTFHGWYLLLGGICVLHTFPGTTSCLLMPAFILICLYSQARNIQRHHTVRRRKPKKNKKTKSKTFLRGPRLLDFLVFLVFFGFALTKPLLFWIFGGKPQKQGFFGFLVGFPVKTQNKPCVFLDFCWKTKKPLGTPQNPKVSGPSHRLLNFWIFGSSAETKKPKIQSLSEGPETFGFFGFP